MQLWPVNAVIHQVNLPGCQQPARAVIVTLRSMLVCLAWTVQRATQQITGLQVTTVRTRALPMKAGEASIMAARRAAIVTQRPCILLRVRNAITGIRKVEEAKAEEGISPWGGALTDAQIHELVSYVHTFCKK